MTVATNAVPTLVLSIDETVKTLRISKTAVFELLKTGQITGIKVGKRRLVLFSSIEEFIAGKAEMAGLQSGEMKPMNGAA